MAILKNAIDYKLYEKIGDKDKIGKHEIILGLGGKELILSVLPESFLTGLSTISKDKYFHKYPTFWQWFMWVFGGSILKDYEEEELKMLSQKTGIPVDEIPNALESYQILFPRDGGWFVDLSPNSNIEIMTMFPVPFMGIGANYRRFLYTDNKKFKELDVTRPHTLNDLIKWNNLAVEALSK